MLTLEHLTTDALEAGLAEVRRSPQDLGTLDLIVRRPQSDVREVLAQAELNMADGLAGDSWRMRGSSRMPDNSPHPDMQLNIINSRLIALLAQSSDRWQLAGDQLYVDLDLSLANLPPWTKLSLGGAVIQVTDQPHTGCAKFVARFGADAMKFVNSPQGRALCLRGICARVMQPGAIQTGDVLRKLP